jgi:hypothetical protein
MVRDDHLHPGIALADDDVQHARPVHRFHRVAQDVADRPAQGIVVSHDVNWPGIWLKPGETVSGNEVRVSSSSSSPR